MSEPGTMYILFVSAVYTCAKQAGLQQTKMATSEDSNLLTNLFTVSIHIIYTLILVRSGQMLFIEHNKLMQHCANILL